MRRLALILLLAITALFPFSSYGAERTWTIARDVYTAEAELVAVRGGSAFLKIDGKVEEIPMERLSALDQQYIASLSLAPILPGPVADAEIVPEEMPLPGEPDAPVANEQEFNVPDLAPAYGGAPAEPQPLPGAAYRVDRYGRVIPSQPGVAASYLAPLAEPGVVANPGDRRYRRGPQGPGKQSAKSLRDEEKDRPGIRGARARRLERQRSSAARTR